jgi:DNA-binding NarL/FixJ family response regulator
VSQEKNLNIVIVDDDLLIRSILRVMLEEIHCTVIGEAGDGETGIETCLRLRPDIAFIDIEMPKLDGHLATGRIRRACPQMSVIMISGLPSVGNLQLAMEAGASGFVGKPLDPVKVSDAIDSCIRQKR